MRKKNPIPGNKPFKKGQSGNPKGRPKKLPELDKLLAEVLGSESNGTTAAEEILQKLCTLAKKGNLRAAEILLDRGYGKPKQAVDLTGNSALLGARVILPKCFLPKEGD